MNKYKIAKNTSIVSFIIVTVLGFLLHFAFEYSGKNTVLAAFVPVNESIWEHLKLVLFPSILISIYEYFKYGKNYQSFLASKTYSIIIGMFFVVVAYYTFTGVTGKDAAYVNIAIYVLSIIIVTALTYYLTIKNPFKFNESQGVIGLTVLTALIILFVYFTFNPPQIELFRDPVTDDFGIVSSIRYII